MSQEEGAKAGDLIRALLTVNTSLDERAIGLHKLYALADMLGHRLAADALDELGSDHPAVAKLEKVIETSTDADGKEHTQAGHMARWAWGAATEILYG